MTVPPSSNFDESLHDKLYYGIKAIFSHWTALQLSIRGEWGGSDSALKSEWFNETMADYIYDNGKKIDVTELEDVLIQIMSDEFTTQLEDNSEIQVAQKIFSLYHELIQGKMTLYEKLVSMTSSSRSEKSANDRIVNILQQSKGKSMILSGEGQLIENDDSDTESDFYSESGNDNDE